MLTDRLWEAAAVLAATALIAAGALAYRLAFAGARRLAADSLRPTPISTRSVVASEVGGPGWTAHG